MLNVPRVSHVFNVRMVKPFLVVKVVVLVEVGIIVTIPPLLDNTKIPIHIPVLRVKIVLPRVVLVLNLLLVQQQEQQIERVQLVLQDQLTKIQHHIPVHRAKRVLLRVVVVPNFLLVHQQQIERVQLALQD